MMDANRIKELADRLRSDQARQNGISQREMESCSDLLDELSRIKSAALPETASEIEKRHAKVLAALGPSGPEYRDIGTLLDALRAKEARCAIWQKAADRFRHDSSTMARRSTENAQAANEANARYNKRVSEMIQKVNDVTGEGDEARAQLAQAQKEIGFLKADAEESRQLRDIAIKSLAARTQELDRAECAKAALREGLRSIRSLVAKFTRPPLSDEQPHFCADALELLDVLVPLEGEAPRMLRRFEIIIGNTYDERDEWGQHEALDEAAVAVAVKEYYEPDCDSLVVWVREVGSDAPPQWWLVSTTREHEARPFPP